MPDRALAPSGTHPAAAPGSREMFRTVTRDGFGVGFAFTTLEAAFDQAVEFDRTNPDRGPHRVQWRSGWQEVGS